MGPHHLRKISRGAPGAHVGRSDVEYYVQGGLNSIYRRVYGAGHGTSGAGACGQWICCLPPPDTMNDHGEREHHFCVGGRRRGQGHLATFISYFFFFSSCKAGETYTSFLSPCAILAPTPHHQTRIFSVRSMQHAVRSTQHAKLSRFFTPQNNYPIPPTKQVERPRPTQRRA